MKHANGLTTRWGPEGLTVSCAGDLKALLARDKALREKARGKCITSTVMYLGLRDFTLLDAKGEVVPWRSCGTLVGPIGGRLVRDVMSARCVRSGEVVFTPTGKALPLSSREAHQFREFGLSLLAHYPELVFDKQTEDFLDVRHDLEDQHHAFQVCDSEGAQLRHTWGFVETHIALEGGTTPVATRIAQFLEVQPGRVWVVPHPWLSKMRPLWTGNRRWRQSRRGFYKIAATKRSQQAAKAMKRTEDKWRQQDGNIETALRQISWRQVQRMEGVSAYQTQNILRLKHNRLRLWNTSDLSFRCMNSSCSQDQEAGTAHLVWRCPDARAFWKVFLGKWGRTDFTTEEEAFTHEVLTDVFTFRLRNLPMWLTECGRDESAENWDDFRKVASDMWALGCATTITFIWRWNIDRKYPQGGLDCTLAGALARFSTGVAEAYARYRIGLYPITRRSVVSVRTAEHISRRWSATAERGMAPADTGITRVGFFDGGSRGNPGKAGSGSVVVELATGVPSERVVWAAATALGHRNRTNNEAEFVGLHRLLAQAQTQGWRGIHIVGDSAIIVNMMQQRKPPKARILRHWYHLSVRLADLLEVKSWSHHYRANNKMADWLANFAMAKRTSVALGGDTGSRFGGLVELLEGDIACWKTARRDGGVWSELEK